MYLKIRVSPAAYGHLNDLARYDFVEVDDDFDPENNELDDDELWHCVKESVFDYVETDYEVLPGDFHEDKDY